MSKREVRNLPRTLMRLETRAGQDVISVCQYQGILIISPELPWWLSGEEFASWVRKIPLEKATATHSNILGPENPMDRGVWWATVHEASRVKTQLSD